jgi:hypothetical protein
MAKAKSTLQSARRDFSGYKFDTSNYLVIERGVYRDTQTGRLMAHKPKEQKPKK